MVREGPIISETPHQTEDYVVLYRQAFQDFGAMALWNKRLLDSPEPEDALVVPRASSSEITLAMLERYRIPPAP